MASDAPIGIFDSGIGGLSVAQEIMHHLPQEKIIYLADTAHVPYGAREDNDIRTLTANAVEWLYKQGCKAVVVACNTASAFSLDHLRQHYGETFPIIGLVPALKPAVLNSKTKTVAVLATPATFRGRLIQDVITNFAQPVHINVLPITCLELVPLIEAGQCNSTQMHQLLKSVLQPAIEQKADHLVLGCTHYPFLKDALNHVFKQQFTLVDSGQAVARQTAKILLKNNLESTKKQNSDAQIQCYFTGGNMLEINNILQELINNEFSWQAHQI